MGFKAPRKVLKLVFEDPDMDGLEVRARSLPLGVFMDDFAGVPTAGTDPAKVTPAQRDASWKVLGAFAGVLLSWNLEEEDGTPIAADLAGLKSLDLDFALKILHAYMDGLAGIDAPLDGSSTSGGTSVVASLPMVPLSESQAS